MSDYDAFADMDGPKKVVVKQDNAKQGGGGKPGSEIESPSTWNTITTTLKNCYSVGKMWIFSVVLIRLSPFVIHAVSMGISRLLGNSE